MKVIEGVYTALATPFLGTQDIDWRGFEKLVLSQIDAGIDGVVISGTTGESPTLSVTEKLSLIRKCKAISGDHLKIMAGSGGNCTKQSIELSKLAVDAGADSLLVVTPPYNKPSAAGLKSHYSSIADAVKVPICVYHVPSRTGQLLSANALAELGQISGVTAFKEASGDILSFSTLVQKTTATVLSGDDGIFLPSLAVGGAGIISVISNLFPKPLVQIRKYVSMGMLSKALEIHQVLSPMVAAIFCESNPGPLKAALAIRGICANVLRLPLAPVTFENECFIRETLAMTSKKLNELLPYE